MRTAKKQRGGDQGDELRDASSRGDLVKVRELITAGADINHVDNKGRTPLYIASETGHVEVVRELLQAEIGRVSCRERV